jgi:hypothetical protein
MLSPHSHKAKFATALSILGMLSFSIALLVVAEKLVQQQASADQSPLYNKPAISSTPVDSSRQITLAGVRSAETIYRYTTDHCDPYEIPDAPARAFRDAQGTVNLVVGVDKTRRWIGPSLDSVVHHVRSSTPPTMTHNK